MYLYKFSVTDYEETHSCDFKWFPQNEYDYKAPTEEEFVKIVMDEAIKLYNTTEHEFYGFDDPTDISSFQQFLRYYFYDIVSAVNDNTVFRPYVNAYKVYVMFSGIEEETLVEQMKRYGIEIPPMRDAK